MHPLQQTFSVSAFKTQETIFIPKCLAFSHIHQWGVQLSLLLGFLVVLFFFLSIEFNCIHLSLLQPFCHLWHIIFLEFIIRRWVVSYVTSLCCRTWIPITDILPLGKESSDFKTQRETNDRALSRTLHLLDTNQRLHFLPSTAAGKHWLNSSEQIQVA